MRTHTNSFKFFNTFIAIFLLALIIPTNSIPTVTKPQIPMEKSPEERVTETEIHEETIDLAETSPIYDFEAPNTSQLSLVETDVAQFDVSESISSQTPQTELDLDNENLTVQIPDGWDLDSHDLNITALYKQYDLIDDPNITLSDDTDPQSPWIAENNLPYEWWYWGFNQNYDNEKLNIEGFDENHPATIIPDSALAHWYQFLEKPDPEMEVWENEYLRAGTTDIPLWNTFVDEPDWENPEDGGAAEGYDWRKNFENPFGGETGTATRDLTYDEVGESLQAYIHAGSSNLTLGSPSIGFQTNFTEPTTPNFTPKQFLLTVAWSVENLNYEASDNLSVIVKIDGQYVDGRIDRYGNVYTNATATSIENSLDNADYLSHETIQRTFDVTDLINTQLTSHVIEFGIWLEGIDLTSDEVRVNFQGLVMQAIEEDQYKIGEVNFDCEVSFETESEMENWYLFSYLTDLQGTEIFLPLDRLSDVFFSPEEEHSLSYDLTSRLKNVFNADDFLVSIGIINAGGTHEAPKDGHFTISFDNLVVSPYYNMKNLTKAGLQLWNGTEYEDVTSPEMQPTIPYTNNNLTLHFRTTNASYYDNSILAFTSEVQISRLRENNASATYYVDVLSSADIVLDDLLVINWNVTYDNADSFTQIVTENHHNFEPTGYNFTIVDLPAWDNLGNESLDWEWTGGVGPLGNTPSSTTGLRTNGTANSGMTQNSTVADATDQIGIDDYINGTWVLFYTSVNYIEQVRIKHEIGISQRYFDGNDTILTVNRTGPSEDTGNYKLTIKNASGEVLTSFPRYFTNQPGNLTETWSVQDFGIGDYELIGVWNDTSGGKTTRVGVLIATFEVWRQSIASLLQEPPILASGEKGTFLLNFTEMDGTPISGGESDIRLHNNATHSLWGRDWPPFLYLVDSVVEGTGLNAGTYTLTFRTRNVPTGDYAVFLSVLMPYYQFQFKYSWINITGSNVDMVVNSGATALSTYTGFIHEDNLPVVDDDSLSIIYVYISGGATPLENGIIAGTFNGSENVFYGEEIYKDTQEETDKGIYSLTLDASGLNTTDRAAIWNYTMTITASVDGYNSTYIGLDTRVLPIITQIDAEDALSVYEGGVFDFYANFQNINDPTTPLPLNEANFTWQLRNSSSDIVITGNFSLVLSGVYQTIVNLDTSTYYVDPGLYNLEINATQINCAEASWMQSNFEILAKDDTNLTLTTNQQLQIGSEMTILANLTYINGTALINTDITLTLAYTGATPFSVVRTTNDLGIASYSQIIPSQYAEQNLTIDVTYGGTSTIHSSSASIIDKFIKGKYAVNLTLNVLSEIRIGYATTISGQISIEGETHYTDTFVTLAGWFDGDSQNLFFIQQIYADSEGNLTFSTPELLDGYTSLTLFVDYAGSSTKEYASDLIGPFTILEKWSPVLELQDLPEDMRQGQSLYLEINGYFSNLSCPEQITDIYVFLTLRIGGSDTIFNGSLNEFGVLVFNYTIPLTTYTTIDFILNTDGTLRIGAFLHELEADILPQMTTTLEIVGIDYHEGYAGEFSFKVLLTDQDGNGIVGQTITFLIRNSDQTTFGTKSAITNEEGIAITTFEFDGTGDFTVEPIYASEGIYQGAEGSISTGSAYTVHVVDFWIQIMDNILYIGVAFGSLVVVSSIAYRGVYIPRRNKQREALMEIHRRFGDIENMQYMLIMHKESGVSIFSQSFSDIPIDESLISGFLTAITSFGKEIGLKVEGKKSSMTPGDQPSGTGLEELAFMQFKIAVIEGLYVRTAVLLLKSPSDTLKNKIRRFNSEFEHNYLDILSHWTGKVLDADPIVESVEKFLHADLLYAHNLILPKVSGYKKSSKKKSTEGRIINEASTSFDNSFKVREMIMAMVNYGKKDVETFNAINDLRKEGIVFAVNPRTKRLIEQFKPFIEPLTPDDRKVIEAIKQGITDLKHLGKTTKIAVVIPIVNNLQQLGIINEQNQLTDAGEVVTMLMDLDSSL